MLSSNNVTQKPSGKENAIWQDVHSDLVAGIKAFSQNISLADIMSDGEWRLICADINCKLKVFKGQLLQNEAKLHFTPVSIASFYAPDTNSKNCVPYLAVAGGPYIFIYKNLKGTFKFLIPNVEPNSIEAQIWTDLKEGKLDQQGAIMQLEEFENKSDLSTRSLELLSIKEDSLRYKFIEERKALPIIISNYVVCMTTIKKNNAEDLVTTSQLVVGTEGGLVYIIDHSGSKIISKFKIPDVPFQVTTVGCFDIDYRIHIAGRNGKIYTIKNGEITTIVIDVPGKICGVVRTDKSIIACTMDSYYHSYNPSGKKNFSIKLPDAITCVEAMEIKKPRSFKGVLISLRNCELRLYNEKNLVNIYKLQENIFGMKFGKFSKIDECLVMITESGSLFVKSLNKTVNLDVTSHIVQPKSGDDVNLNVPKKTKLYLDLIEREKEVAGNMNSVFQNDLIRLRHKTLDTYVKMLKIGNAPQNYSTTSKVKLIASLQGLGPNFKLNLILDNSGDEAIFSTDLILEFDRNTFYFEKENIQLGILMPNVPVKYSLKFKNISDNGNSGIIKIIVVDKIRPSPLITSTVKVPISELEIL
jgi:Bardet-Biedl syndrome 1 protein